MLKFVHSALSDLKRPLNVYSPSAIIGLSLLNSILMARFLKQSFAQTCLKDELGRENVPCVAEVVNGSLKADCTDFMKNSTKQMRLNEKGNG